MFVTQVHNKPISAEEKFGYLLEMVTPAVRGKIGNLKPGEVGYKTAWERLKTEYGQNKLVVSAHVQEIVNRPSVKGTHFSRIQEFYENLSRNYDALVTMSETDMLRGFVISTLNKLPNMEPDLVRTDDDWENWQMVDLTNNLQRWLKRNRMEEQPGPVRENQKRERHWYTAKGDDKSPPDQTKVTPVCLYCKQGHWGDRIVKRTRHWRAEGSFSRIIDCAITAEGRDTLVIIAEAVAVSNEKGGITQAFVTGMTTPYSPCIRLQPRTHSQL